MAPILLLLLLGRLVVSSAPAQTVRAKPLPARPLSAVSLPFGAAQALSQAPPRLGGMKVRSGPPARLLQPQAVQRRLVPALTPRSRPPQAVIRRPNFPGQQELSARRLGPTLGSREGLSSPGLSRAFDGLGLRADATLGSPNLPVLPPSGGRIVVPKINYFGLELEKLLFSRKTPIAPKLAAVLDATPAGEPADLALHGVSLPDVTQSLINAHRRGVLLRIIMNHSHVYPERPGQTRSREIEQIIAAKVPMWTLKGGGPYGTQHNKLGLFARRLLKIGSFNWSSAANTKNDENVMFRNSPSLLVGLHSYFEWMLRQAVPLGGEKPPPDTRGPPRDESLPLRYKGQPWPEWAVSPRGGIQGWILRGIELLQPGESHDIADFGFYSQKIAAALLDTKNRGVAIRIVMDLSQSRSSPLARFFVENGFNFRVKSGRNGQGVMHEKFMDFNHELLENGSYNLSENAELNNYENAYFSTDPADISPFHEEFEYLWSEARPPTPQEIASFPTLDQYLQGHEDLILPAGASDLPQD